MAFTLWSLFEASLLCLNAVCILHEERFMAKSRYYTISISTGETSEVRFLLGSIIIVIEEAGDHCMSANLFNCDDVAVGWGANQNIQGFGEQPTVKAQILNLVRSIRTVARIPLIFLNILTIIIKLILG